MKLVLDTECYANFFLAKFKSIESKVSKSYQQYDGQSLDIKSISSILGRHTIITFNGNGYDIPMLTLALTGASCAELKKASDWLIVGEHTAWEFYDHYGLERPDWIDHIDLIEVAPGQASLKLYGGRLHSKRLQDLPIDPSAIIAPHQRPLLDDYCGNDLDTTIDLYTKLTPQIELRERMSKDYGIDLRSKSDAQIAEAVIRKDVAAILGQRVERPVIPPGTVFRYKAPAFIKFRTKQLQNKLLEIQASDFVISDSGAPIEPPALDGAVIVIGSGAYRMGIGGLHSSETTVAHAASNSVTLMDADVASYYPNIILNCGLFPKHMGSAFTKVYKKIVDERLAAKRAKNTVVADALKITINGSFGKLGSMFSALYAPDLMIQVTVTGQLALLMLIETLHADGIACVSANTDGIVLKFPTARIEEVRRHISDWMKATGFEMEETHYRAVLSRDVNNYIALKNKDYYRSILSPEQYAKMDKDGWIKGKGAYANVSIAKNPTNTICVEAVKQYVENGTPIAQTIISCRDIRKFLTVRTVKGGAVKITKTKYDDKLTPAKKRDFILAHGWHMVVPGPLTRAKFYMHPEGVNLGMDVETAYRMHCGEDEFDYIGKVVRWYYSTSASGAIHYKAQNKKGNRNKVPNSEGAKPLMELPEEMPNDIDYEFYIGEAISILKDIGAMK